MASAASDMPLAIESAGFTVACLHGDLHMSAGVGIVVLAGREACGPAPHNDRRLRHCTLDV